MSKSHVNVNVTTMLLEEAKLNHINLSATLENALESKLAVLKGDSKGIDKKLLLHQKSKVENKVNRYSSELATIMEQLRQIEEFESKTEEEKIKMEQEEAEKAITCKMCGNQILNDKLHKCKTGVICNGCFMSGERDQVNKHIKE